MLAGILPRLASLALQPAVLAAGVATGVAVGAVGVGTGAIPVADAGPRNAPLYECPGSDRVVTSIRPNQNVLVTARSADGQWLQIYVGAVGVEQGWAPASALQLRAAPDSLPIATCTPTATAAPLPTTLEPPSVAPTASIAATTAAPTGAPQTAAATTAATASPSPKPTKTPGVTAVPTASPTPGPAQFISSISLLDVPKDLTTGTYIFYPPGCESTGATHARFRVTATDMDGIATVSLVYQLSDFAQHTLVMTPLSGDVYEGQIQSDGTWPIGRVNYWVEVEDLLGNTSIRFGDNQHILAMDYCSD